MQLRSELDNPAWLLKLDDGKLRFDHAHEAIKTLQKFAEPLRHEVTEAEIIRQRQARAKQAASARASLADELGRLRVRFLELKSLEPQPRGYALENLLTDLFRLFDMDTKGPFKIHGEQVDGAFTLRGTEYLLEAKWRSALTALPDLESFGGKVKRKLDNTLGLFLSMSGFQPNAIELAQHGGRPLYLLMDGGDLIAVLEDRIALTELIDRKKQHAARTGQIYVSAWQLIGTP